MHFQFSFHWDNFKCFSLIETFPPQPLISLPLNPINPNSPTNILLPSTLTLPYMMRRNLLSLAASIPILHVLRIQPRREIEKFPMPRFLAAPGIISRCILALLPTFSVFGSGSFWAVFIVYVVGFLNVIGW